MGVSCVFYSTQIYKLLTAVNDHRRVYRCTGVLWAQAPRLAKRMGNVLCTLSSSAMYHSGEDLNVYGAGGGGGGGQAAPEGKINSPTPPPHPSGAPRKPPPAPPPPPAGGARPPRPTSDGGRRRAGAGA